MTGRRRRGLLGCVDAFEEALPVVAEGSVLQPITNRMSSVEQLRNENNCCFDMIATVNIEEK